MQTTQFLARTDDELPLYPPASTSLPNLSMAAGREARRNWKLEDVERWTMVKRIW